jgi:hypothetical protein
LLFGERNRNACPELWDIEYEVTPRTAGLSNRQEWLIPRWKSDGWWATEEKYLGQKLWGEFLVGGQLDVKRGHFSFEVVTLAH